MTTLLVGGLAGSATHCVGMCAPFVASQTATRLAAAPMRSEWQRLAGAALVPYHLGRMTTYVLLGVAVAAFSAQFRSAAWFHWVSAALLIAAACVFLGTALGLAARFRLPAIPGLMKITEPLCALFAAPYGARGYALGLALGLLPCGLVYAALMTVMAEGDVPAAALGMALFALGTVPALVAAGMGGAYALGRWRAVARYAMPPLLIFNSIALFIMAGDLLR